MLDDVRAELTDLLQGYLQGAKSVQDVIEWEAEYGLAAEVADDLRRDLDQLALVGEEVLAGMRDEPEFREVAEGVLGLSSPRAHAR